MPENCRYADGAKGCRMLETCEPATTGVLLSKCSHFSPSVARDEFEEHCPCAGPPNPRAMKWAYGVTTVPSRRRDLLPRTLASLKAAGFCEPRLFVDGDKDGESWEREFGLSVTARYPAVRTYGNWYLAMLELYIREPTAERYAIFQDDFVTVKNLKAYLSKAPYPERGYLNLYTFPANQALAPLASPGGVGAGFYKSNQKGRGAVALVFSREAVVTLLSSHHMAERPMHATRGWKAVDGGIVTAMEKAGWCEYVHDPSLTQHVGDVSSMGNKQHKKAETFPGERFDAMTLLR